MNAKLKNVSNFKHKTTVLNFIIFYSIQQIRKKRPFLGVSSPVSFPSSVLLSFGTFNLVSRYILNTCCNNSDSVNYYFITDN